MKEIYPNFPTIDFALRSTWNAVVKYYNKKGNAFDLNMVLGFTLLIIDPKRGTPSTMLGPKMGMEPTSLSRTLKRLEDFGFIERHPNPNDGRSVLIVLTESGLEVRNHARNVVHIFNTELIERVGEEKLYTFFEVCDNIQNLIQNKS